MTSKNFISVMKDVDNKLSYREKKILFIRLRLGYDDAAEFGFEKISKEFGITRERIRQIELKAIERVVMILNQQIKNDYFDKLLKILNKEYDQSNM